MITLLLLFYLFPVSTDNATLTVEVNGFRSDNGKVIMRIWQDEGKWLKKEGVLQKVKIGINKGKAVYTFTDLVPGKYAMAFVHDENENGHLDFNFAKIPKEGTGASNNASATFGPPKFEDAAFILSAGEKKNIAVKLKYYL